MAGDEVEQVIPGTRIVVLPVSSIFKFLMMVKTICAWMGLYAGAQAG